MKHSTSDGDPETRYTHPDPITDAALEWFVFLQGPSADSRRAEFEAWQTADPRHRAAFDEIAGMAMLPELRAAGQNAAALMAGDPQDELAARRHSRSPPIVQASNKSRRGVRLAAAVLLIALGVQAYPALTLRWDADYLTGTGDRRDVVLPDGSRMILNTGSAVGLDFANGRRSVNLLRGEAYFDVVHDAARPFRVTAQQANVEVRGTSFSVRSDEAIETVVLERGRVEVLRKTAGGNPLALDAGDVATITSSKLSRRHVSDIAALLAWREGLYVFEDEPLTAVAANLARYYRSYIVIADDSIGKKQVSGNYRVEDPVGAMRSLAEVVGADMTVLPGGVILLR